MEVKMFNESMKCIYKSDRGYRRKRRWGGYAFDGVFFIERCIYGDVSVLLNAEKAEVVFVWCCLDVIVRAAAYGNCRAAACCRAARQAVSMCQGDFLAVWEGAERLRIGGELVSDYQLRSKRIFCYINFHHVKICH